MSGKSIFQNHAHPHISYLFSLPDHRLRRQDSDASVHSVPGATVPPHFQKQVAYITDEKLEKYRCYVMNMQEEDVGVESFGSPIGLHTN